MNRNLYMPIDLLLLSVLAVITDFFGFYALKKYPGAGFSLSLSMLVTVIAMIRWGGPGFIVHTIAGAALVIFNRDLMPLDFLILYYPLAGSFVALVSLFFLFKRPGEIKNNKYLFIAFQLAAYFCAGCGKGVVTLIYQKNFLTGLMSYGLANVFSVPVTIVISLLLLKREGLITEMAALNPAGQGMMTEGGSIDGSAR